jgi:hypothetical protein
LTGAKGLRATKRADARRKGSEYGFAPVFSARQSAANIMNLRSAINIVAQI